MVDANGNFDEYKYDVLSRLTKIISPGDSDSSPTTEFSYGADSMPLMRKIDTKLGSSQETVLFEYFDGHGKSRQVQLKKDGSTYIVSGVSYDNLGNPYQTYKTSETGSSGLFIAPNQFFTTVFPGIDYTQAEYYTDPLSRILRARPFGDKSLFVESVYGKENDSDDAYEYATVTITDENGNQRLTKTDRLGNTIEVKEADLATGKITQGSFVTKYVYDVVGNLLAQKDALGHVAANEYNSLNQLVKSVHPDLGTTEMEYDRNGNLIRKVTSKGAITYQYDIINRLIHMQYPDGTSFSYYYDIAPSGSSTLCTNGKERICMIEGDYGKTAYDYDARGRVIRSVYETGGKKYATTYEYDSADNLVAMTDPAGTRTVYEYDNANRLKSVKANYGSGLEEVASYSYNPTSTINGVQFGNGVSTSYNYDQRELLEGMDVKNGSSQIFARGYGFDKSGNIVSLYSSPMKTGKLADFSYDRLYKLTGVDDNGYFGTGMAFTYDAVGNRQTMMRNGNVFDSQSSYETNPALQSIRLINVSSGGLSVASLGYDATGNVVQKNAERFVYDIENRLECSGDDTLYVYTSDGKRVKKIQLIDGGNIVTTVYVYDIEGNIVYAETVRNMKDDDWMFAERCISV